VAAYIVVQQTYQDISTGETIYDCLSFLQAALYVILVAAFVVFGLGLAGAALACLISVLLIALISTYNVLRDIGVTRPSFAQLKVYPKFRGLVTL
jgi:Na+-driven multidrug efflux pump